MKITSNWLKEHLETILDEDQIIEKLTDVGLEVESVEKQGGKLDDFVVAKILKAEKHPNADKLRVCDVDISTSQTLSLSALGCFSAFKIFATTKSSSLPPCFSTLSTSRPTSVSFSII